MIYLLFEGCSDGKSLFLFGHGTKVLVYIARHTRKVNIYCMGPHHPHIDSSRVNDDASYSVQMCPEIVVISLSHPRLRAC